MKRLLAPNPPRPTWSAAAAGLAWLGIAAAALAIAGGACRGRAAGPAAKPSSDTAPFLARRVLALEKEQRFAAGDKAYFVLDLGRKTLDLRMSGLTLRTWSASAVRCWGLTPGAQEYVLVQKSALNPPQRRLLKPAPLGVGEGEDAAPDAAAAPSTEPEALELDDMPALFDLSFDGDLDIQVTTGERGRVWRVLDELAWHIRTPLQTLVRALRRRPFTRIRLTMAERTEAQSIYWSLAEGSRGLILMPEPPPKVPAS